MDGYNCELYFSFEEKTNDKRIICQEYGYPIQKDFTETWKKIKEIQKKSR